MAVTALPVFTYRFKRIVIIFVMCLYFIVMTMVVE